MAMRSPVAPCRSPKLKYRKLSLVPGSQARPPAPYVPAIIFVVLPKLVAQRGLFIEDDEQMHPEGNSRHGRDRRRIRVPENYPQPDPAYGEAYIHRVAKIAVKTYYHQTLGRGDRGRSSAARPPEVPYAAKGNRESQHRWNCTQPRP